MLFPASVSGFSPGNKDCIQYRCSGFWHRHVSGSSISCRERQYCRNKKSFSCQRSVCSLSFWKCCGKSDSRLHTVPHSRKAVKKSSDCFLSCGSRILEEQRHLPESSIGMPSISDFLSSSALRQQRLYRREMMWRSTSTAV